MAPQDVARVSAEKELLFVAEAKTKLRPLPGVVAMLERARARALPICLVTNAPRCDVPLSHVHSSRQADD